MSSIAAVTESRQALVMPVEELRSERTHCFRASLYTFVGIFLIGSGCLMLITALMGNTVINTTNGLWKSIPMSEWVMKTHGRSLDVSNFLYYPANARLIRYLLPKSVFGTIWQRMAFLNCIYAGFALAWIYVLMRGLGAGAAPALSAVIFQAGCAFFLILAITNEDIMPSIAFLVASMAAAVHLFKRPTAWGIFVVAQLFTLSWLFEWRVMFPTLPAFVLTLVLLPGTISCRIRRPGLFLISCLVLPICCELYANLIVKSTPAITFDQILWTGKAVDSGYGGFTWNKVVFLFVGMQQYLYGGVNVGSIDFVMTRPFLKALIAVSGLIAYFAYVFARMTAKAWAEPAWRTAAVLVGGTFVFGEFFNLYSQPQDPQMQLNVMIWLPVAWGMFCLGKMPLLRNGRLPHTCAVLGLSFLPLLANLYLTWPARGREKETMAAVTRLAQRFDPHQTVFVSNGFEGENTWQTVMWGTRGYPVEFTGRNAPVYKPIYLLDEGTSHPERSPEASARTITQMVDLAIDNGLKVVINNVWDMGEKKYVDTWATISSGPDKPLAIYRELKKRYTSQLGLDDRELGRYHELTRQPKGQEASKFPDLGH